MRIMEDSNDINKMFKYSAIKIAAKQLLLYSVLNPDTISLSPSARSNGLRFVSANVVINHKPANIGATMIILVLDWFTIFINPKAGTNTSINNKVILILTSYEIVCATLRIDPINEYLELEVHPAARVV